MVACRVKPPRLVIGTRTQDNQPAVVDGRTTTGSVKVYIKLPAKQKGSSEALEVITLLLPSTLAGLSLDLGDAGDRLIRIKAFKQS